MKKALVILTTLTALLAGCAQEVEDFENEEEEIAPLQVDEDLGMKEGHVTRGIITAIDPAVGELTVEHAPVPGLELPAGTRQFGLADQQRLEELTVGDPIRFNFVESDTGEYVIQDFQEE
ncbi:copper-binding protein [Proteobacteria bacterium 005FR1]|nr:copper-binding protein [Proteobacteria bacterium 005FR1]